MEHEKKRNLDSGFEVDHSNFITHNNSDSDIDPDPYKKNLFRKEFNNGSSSINNNFSDSDIDPEPYREIKVDYEETNQSPSKFEDANHNKDHIPNINSESNDDPRQTEAIDSQDIKENIIIEIQQEERKHVSIKKEDSTQTPEKDHNTANKTLYYSSMNDSVSHNNSELVSKKDKGILTSELEEVVIPKPSLNDRNSNKYQSENGNNSTALYSDKLKSCSEVKISKAVFQTRLLNDVNPKRYQSEYGNNIPITYASMLSNCSHSFGYKMESTKQRVEQKFPPKKTYVVQFNVYLPPIFKIDIEELGKENFNVGIITSLEDFKPKRMHHLSLKPFENNGYLVNGKVEFPIDKLRFEYKYLLSFNDTNGKSFIIEFLEKHKNREFRNLDKRNQSLFRVYDGIMLPPDKESESFYMSLKSSVKKILGGTYFDESLYDAHKDDTINAMFHEIRTNDETKFKSLDSTIIYLDNVIQGLQKVFKDRLLIEKIYRFLIDDLKHTEVKPLTRFIIAVAILKQLYQNCSKYQLYQWDNIFNSVLVILLNQELEINEICSILEKRENIQMFMEFYDVSKSNNPNALYFLNLHIQLKLKDKFDHIHSLTRTIAKIDCDHIYSEEHVSVMKNIKSPSDIFLATCFKGFFMSIKRETKREKLIDLFPTKVLLTSLEVDFNGSSYSQFAQRLKYSDQLFLKLVFIINDSISKTIKQNNEMAEANYDHMLKILEKAFVFVNHINWDENNKNLLILALIKFNAWCLMKNGTELNIDNIKILTIDRILKSVDIDRYNFIFKCWNIVFEIKTLSQQTDELLTNTIENFIVMQLKNLDTRKLLSIINYFSIPQNSNHIHEYIKNYTIEAVKFKIDKMSPEDINKLMNLNCNEMNLLSNEILNKKWPAEENDRSIFNFIFEFNHFLKLYFFVEHNQYNDEYQQKKLKIISLVESTLKSLTDGSINISVLNMLNDKRAIVNDLFKMFSESIVKKPWNDTDQVDKIMNKIFDYRIMEVENYAKFYKFMREFDNFMKIQGSSKKIDTVDFQECLKKGSQYENKNLSSLVNQLDYTNEICRLEINSNEVNLNERIKNFCDINRQDLVFIREFLDLYCKNPILKNFLDDQDNTEVKMIRIENFISQMKEARKMYMDLGNKILKGTLLFKQFDFLFQNKNSMNDFGVIMDFVGMAREKKSERLEQIDIYKSLDTIKMIVKVLLEIKEKNELTENFDVLEEMDESLSNNDYHNKSFNEIDEKTMSIYRKLEKLSSKNLFKCLQSFNDNFEFIQWLRKVTPDLNALKLLCEFASESENEGALEVVRVQSLAMVGTAYSPLIFDLKQNFSYDQLIQQIYQVNENLKKNPHLSEKINAIAREKSWLEEVKDSKGNTEVNSLKQAVKINNYGVYEFGLVDDFKGDSVQLKDIIKLHLFVKEDNFERYYTYDQLSELHDKLTLVVGKERNQQNIIHYFEDIFEGMINMGQLLIDLIKTGNVLFKNWTVNVYCNEDYRYTMRINFGVKCQNIFIDRADEKSTVNSLQKTSTFLQHAYNEWLAHIDFKREEYPIFDYFQIDQLVMLRTYLAEYLKATRYSTSDVKQSDYKKIFNLTFDINSSESLDLLNEANKHAFNRQKGILFEATPEEQATEKSTESEVQIQLRASLIDLGFNNSLISQAFKEVESFDYDTLVEYCFQNESLEEDLKDVSGEVLDFDQVKSNFKTSGHQSLEKIYEQLWSDFVKFLDTNFDDFVSLNHLGLVLDYLQSKANLVINRLSPAYLETGVPNLIVCPQNQIIKHCLNIYANSPDQPLPATDEVIYCTAKTTCEQLELFWRRCLFSQSEVTSKIYCLLNVQDLLYDRAVKAHLTFQKLQGSQRVSKDYKLCIFCSSEREDKSVLATAFSRNKKNILLDRNINEKLSAYTSEHFKISPSNESGKSLKQLDKDQLCVRVVTSDRASNGKSLYINRQIEMAHDEIDAQIETYCISVKNQTLPFDSVFKDLQRFDSRNGQQLSRIIHIDIAYEVWYDVDYFLFNLLCLGVVQSITTGEIFRRSSSDLYLIEIMSPMFESQDTNEKTDYQPLHSILSIIPSLCCLGPTETFQQLSHPETNQTTNTILFDEKILHSALIQRPCQYLFADQANSNNYTYSQEESLDARTCLDLLLKHLEHKNPSWSEIIHFASFLNTQLTDCEKSNFCDERLTGDLLPGFKKFVVKFMIQMSHDFALPSLDISDKSALQMKLNKQAEFDLDQLKIRRKWENHPHPYLFFNPDGQTFTFFGLYVDRATGNLIDPNTNQKLFDELSIGKALMQGIELQDGNLLRENIASMSKKEKIFKLLCVMGMSWMNNQITNVVDPDLSYELTMDNVLKMIAIYMRLRANIPVIIMGETGCGKTRLCKYMCQLQVKPNAQKEVISMYLVKVHGGTTTEDIKTHVRKAEALAKRNRVQCPEMFTILFFDEANSTEAIGTIKEIMCDHKLDGQSLDKNTGLKFIAACNPYRKHSPNAIRNFERSGLGFYTDIDETQEKLGNVPMRHLIYRVQPLPVSMLPLIWDFGQLNDHVEKLYIAQITNECFCVNNYRGNRALNDQQIDLIVELLSCSQRFMRHNNSDECSFVSLRDVQRALEVIQWFLKNGDVIFGQMTKYKAKEDAAYADDNEDEGELDAGSTDFIRAIILALNTCYHVGLQNEVSRERFRANIAPIFMSPSIDSDYINDEINVCYEVFLDEIQLPDAIARNQALKENVFMMLLCIELKIPLFIIGKPGSSKSLAKTLIAQKMTGIDHSNSVILQNFKEAHLITFQCSPLSTSDMILKTFRYCAKYQLERREDLDRYATVVVLDEIGLAEASPSMALKTLHPLLEDGVYFDETEKEVEEKELMEQLKKNKSFNSVRANDTNKDWLKIGFIGISNWVLDPAKMNRGILVNRTSPTTEELIETVEGICKHDPQVLRLLKENNLVDSLSNGYLNLCESAKKTRDFFGLRDFYSLIKMIYWHIKNEFEESSNIIEWSFIQKAIKRNFGGLIGIDPVQFFLEQFNKDKIKLDFSEKSETKVIDMIKEALTRKTTEDDNRYLLLLTTDENALNLINNYILNELDDSNIKIVFGSSFPNDQKYSQICRKIHQIKLSMELGKTVVLLNLENLYESLYDVLNQFYYKFGDNEKFVDLGLGTQRVKCLVHKDFRLIVVANKESVYDPKKYPIPLVSRLEKHILTVDLVLDKKMKQTVRHLETWCDRLTEMSNRYAGIRASPNSKLRPSDIFIGYSEDLVPTLVNKLWKDDEETVEEKDEASRRRLVVQKTQDYLIQCASADGIIRLLLQNKMKHNMLTQSSYVASTIQIESALVHFEEIVNTYFKFQYHNNFKQFFNNVVIQESSIERTSQNNFIQITTHSKLLTYNDLKVVNSQETRIRLEALVAFNTQQQLVQVLNDFFNQVECPNIKNHVLIIQCDCGHFHDKIIKCARNTIDDVLKNLMESKSRANKVPATTDKATFKIVLIIQIPKISGGCISGFQVDKWACYHIDDFMDNFLNENILNFQNKSLSAYFTEAAGHKNHSYETLLRILKSIVHTSCSKIAGTNPQERNSNRSIKRIEILIDLLARNENFCTVLLGHIARLQQARETLLSSDEISRSWLFKEGAKLENVIRFGTLKKSCLSYIETRLSHLLTGIIALIDSHNNLDLLVASEQDCLRDFWMDVFSNETIMGFDYGKLFLQANSHIEKKQFICMNSIQRRDVLKLPFSWLFKQFLDQLVHVKIKEIKVNKENLAVTADKSCNLAEQLKAAFVQSPIYESLYTILEAASSYHIKDNFTLFYLNDLLVISSNDSFINDVHLKLVKNRLVNYCREKYSLCTKELESLIVYHLALDDLKQEFGLFAKFAQLNSNILQEIVDKKQTSLNLCFQASRIISNKLSTPNNIMKIIDWESWFSDVKKNTRLIDQYIALYPSDLNGDKSEKAFTLKSFRSVWQKVLLLKIFIEHLCHIDQLLYGRCMTLWNYFDKDLDLKQMVFFRKLLKFIQMISKMIDNKYSKACKGCNIKRSDLNMYMLDCEKKCDLCEDCFKKMRFKCPGCQEKPPKNGFIEIISHPKNILFKKSLNGFFMDVVNDLCFDDKDNLPESEVIDIIMQNLMPKTKTELASDQPLLLDFNLNKSIKSTLFQLLLNYKRNEVVAHLDRILSESKKFLETNYRSEDLIGLKLMFINAIEDNFNSKQSFNMTKSKMDLDIELGIRFLENLIQGFNEPVNELDQLETIAKIKFIVVTFARVFSEYESCESRKKVNFVKLVELFVDNCESMWPRFFLIKYVFRKYGKNVLMCSKNSDLFEWIIPNELIAHSNDELQDSYVVCGPEYVNLRTSFQDAFYLGQFSKLKKQENFTFAVLAAFKTITLSDKLTNYEKKCHDLLQVLCDKYKQHKVTFENLIAKNNQPDHFIKNKNHKTIALLVNHVHALLIQSNKKSILKPFSNLLEAPEKYAKSYLPSVPHDEDFEIFQILDNDGTFQCENGHLYTIGNCKRPAFNSVCHTCKRPIGGTNYVLAQGNKIVSTLKEKQQTGYCISRASQRSEKPESIRNMGSLNTTIIRLILDCTLYLASLQHKNTHDLLLPEDHLVNNRDFFANQILKDVDLLSACLQHSPEESLLLVHLLLNNANQIKPSTIKLDTKQKRNEFEDILCKDFIARTVGNDFDRIIKQMSNVVAEDTRNSGSNQLFKISYDLLSPEDLIADESDVDFFNNKKYWTFRKAITIESVINLFTNQNLNENENLKILNEFFKKIEDLQLLKFLPNIVKMVLILHRTFHRQILREYADRITIGDITKNNELFDNLSIETIRSGAADFLKVWQTLKDVLSLKFANPLDVKNQDLLGDPELLPVSYMLPSTTSNGRYIYGLVFYLINLQNSFLHFFYDNQTKYSGNKDQVISLESLTTNDVISFAADKDLLQIVYINSNYSYESGEEINLEYDFNKIQMTIISRFMEDKALIESANIPLIEFSDDINDINRFVALNKHVKQVELSYLAKEKISSFYKQPNDLNEIICEIHIVIDFVILTGSKEDMKIMDYAGSVLKMSIDKACVNKHINDLEVCYLKSLWNLLSFKRAVLLTQHKQDPFSQLSEQYKEMIEPFTLSSEIEYQVIAPDHAISASNLFHMLNMIYRIIQFKLTSVAQGEANENLSMELNMADVIETLMDEGSFNDLEGKIDLPRFCLEDIKLKNIFHLWKLLINIYLSMKDN